MNNAYLKIIKYLETYAENNWEIKRFISGNVDDLANLISIDEAFPVMYSSQSFSSTYEDYNEIRIRVHILERLMEDGSNSDLIKNKTLSIINNLDAWLRSNQYEFPFDIFGVATITPFNNRTMTKVEGWYIDINIEYEKNFCDIPMDDFVYSEEGCEIYTKFDYLTCDTLNGCESFQLLESDVNSNSNKISIIEGDYINLEGRVSQNETDIINVDDKVDNYINIFNGDINSLDNRVSYIESNYLTCDTLSICSSFINLESRVTLLEDDYINLESRVSQNETDINTLNSNYINLESRVTLLEDDKADKTITLTAGVGLIGGGDLSADRTFDIEFGNVSGTVAEGNDSRFHTHSNMNILDNITQTDINTWNSALQSSDLIGLATETWVTNNYLPLSGGIINGELEVKIVYWTFELMEKLEYILYPSESLKFDSINNIVVGTTPTITIEVNDSPYTFGDNISIGDKVKVISDTPCVVELKVIK